MRKRPMTSTQGTRKNLKSSNPQDHKEDKEEVPVGKTRCEVHWREAQDLVKNFAKADGSTYQPTKYRRSNRLFGTPINTCPNCTCSRGLFKDKHPEEPSCRRVRLGRYNDDEDKRKRRSNKVEKVRKPRWKLVHIHRAGPRTRALGRKKKQTVAGAR